MGPAPPPGTGPHRYALLVVRLSLSLIFLVLFEQGCGGKGRVGGRELTTCDIGQYRETKGKNESKVGGEEKDRKNFGIDEYVKENGLELVSSSFPLFNVATRAKG